MRLGDRRVAHDPGGLGPTEVLQVRALGGDVLELERVEHQALVGQRVLGLLGDGRGEGRPVADDLLDGQPTDDRAQGTGEYLTGRFLDPILLVQEPLGGGPDRVLGATHLDDRHALQVGPDALLAHRALDLHVDPPAGQAHHLQLLHDRQIADARQRPLLHPAARCSHSGQIACVATVAPSIARSTQR